MQIIFLEDFVAEVLPDLHPNYHGIVETMVCSMAARCDQGVTGLLLPAVRHVSDSGAASKEGAACHTLCHGICGRWNAWCDWLRRFVSTFGSTFSANVNRIRGYHSSCLVPDKGIYFVNWPTNEARHPSFATVRIGKAACMTHYRHQTSTIHAIRRLDRLTTVSPHEERTHFVRHMRKCAVHPFQRMDGAAAAG